MDEDSAQKLGIVALVFALLAVGLAITASKTRITDNLDMDNYYIINTNIVQKHIRIPASNLGRNPTDPPVINVYGICHVAEFTVGADLAYYKICVPPDFVPGTDVDVTFYWTRSTTGSDESGKRVNWQLKHLIVTVGENVGTGETADNMEDVYDDADVDGRIAYQTDAIAIPGAAAGKFLIMECGAIPSSGTDLSKPALLGFCIAYKAYQVQPPQGD